MSFSYLILGYILVVMLFFALDVRAQINESDSSRYKILSSVTGFMQRGNVDFSTLRARAELLFAANQNWVVKSENASLSQWFGSFKADNDILSRNFVYWNPKSRLYPFAIGFAQTNYRRQINFRWFAGLGATFQAIQHPNHRLKLSGGMLRESTVFRTDVYNTSEYNGLDTISLWRSTVYTSGWHKLGSMGLELTYQLYWQPSFESIPNYRYQADVSVSAPIHPSFRLRIDYLHTYEHVVASTITQTDRILSLGLSFSLIPPKR